VEQQSFAAGCKYTHISPNAYVPHFSFVPSIMSRIHNC